MTLGGRAAEEIVFGEITTGASNDLEKVTATAKQMVMRFGMSEKLGPRVFGHDHGQPFLGREFSSEPDYSDEIAREIDDEIRRIVEGAHQVAKDILGEHRESLESISELLLKRETIEREEFVALLDGTPEAEMWPELPEGPERPELPGPVTRERERPSAASRVPASPAAPPSCAAATSPRSRNWHKAASACRPTPDRRDLAGRRAEHREAARRSLAEVRAGELGAERGDLGHGRADEGGVRARDVALEVGHVGPDVGDAGLLGEVALGVQFKKLCVEFEGGHRGMEIRTAAPDTCGGDPASCVGGVPTARGAASARSSAAAGRRSRAGGSRRRAARGGRGGLRGGQGRTDCVQGVRLDHQCGAVGGLDLHVRVIGTRRSCV